MAQVEVAAQVDPMEAAVQVEQVEVVDLLEQAEVAEAQVEAAFLMPDLFQVQVELVLEYLLMYQIS